MDLQQALDKAKHGEQHDFAAKLQVAARENVLNELAQVSALFTARRLAEEVRSALPLAEASAANARTRWDLAAGQVREEETRLANIPVLAPNHPNQQQQRNAMLNLLRDRTNEARKSYEAADNYLRQLRTVLAWAESCETWKNAPILRRVLAELQG